MHKYRYRLPQLQDRLFLMDGGMETDLIFQRGIEVPHFAVFDLLSTGNGCKILKDYFIPYFSQALEAGEDWVKCIRAVRANASCKSHAELDESTTLDRGDPVELGNSYKQLRETFPHLTILGGCCGTDIEHIRAISRAC